MDTVLFKSFFPEIFLCTIVLFQLICNSRLITTNSINYPLINFEIVSQGLFILLCLSLLSFNQLLEVNSVNSLFVSDFSTRWVKSTLLVVSLLVFIYIWKSFVTQQINFFEYFSLFFFSLLGSLLLINTNDLISAYIVIELQALSFYLIASFNKNSSFSTEAGLKYFILGSFASGIFLMGSVLTYLSLGTLNFDSISLLLFAPLATDVEFLTYCLLLGCFLIIVTVFFQTAVAPFHFWSPDVYEGSPLSSTITFSIIPKLAFFSFLMHWVSLYINTFLILKFLFVSVGLFSIFWGAYSALLQKRFKRFIIFSSISQIGFVIIAISVFSLESYAAAYFYIYIYLITSVILWSIFSKIYSFNIEKIRPSIFLSDLTSYFKLNYVLAFSVILIFFSFSGIPPFSGFLSKALILFGLVADNNILASVITIIISVLSSYYYLKIIKIMFFDKKVQFDISKKYLTNCDSTRPLESLISSVCIYLLFFLFFFPSNLILLSNLLVINLGII